MAHEPIYNFRRPGFPKPSYSKDAYRTVIEYVGLMATLYLHSPRMSSEWGEHEGLVTDEWMEPLEGTEYGVLTVVCERKFDPAEGEGGLGTKVQNATTYEIEWVDVQRSLFEHPAFRLGAGGDYELDSEDVEAVKKWQVNPDPDYKKDFIYDKAEVGDHQGTLSTNAKMLARGLQMGIEYWVDKQPVARRSDTYVKGPPPEGSAGQKDDPEGFDNLPEGYEWIRSSDRAVKAGSQSSWTRDTEWIGCDKVLIDVDEIFWTAPT